MTAGERVILFAKNAPEWSMAYFGILKLGATAVPIANDSTVAEMVNVARASGAAGILIGDDLHDKRSGLTRALREAEPGHADLAAVAGVRARSTRRVEQRARARRCSARSTPTRWPR